MYLEHFGLQRQPFKITPDTSLFYTGNRRGAALEALKYAIESGEGIIKVVGEVGSGKTMLCRMLEIELPDQIEIVYIANPSLSPENILHVIAFELKLAIDNESSRLEVMQQLQNYLVDRHAQGKQVVVFVEEAQSMPIETLEEIRLLSNLETADHKLLQMVLFGQPELDQTLREPSIRQLKERITHSFYLDPFPSQDIYEYLNFRMRAVGYRGPNIFSSRIARSIEKKSHGLTRRINILADKALMAVYSDGAHCVQNRHIALAAQDSDFGAAINLRPLLFAVAATLVIGVAVWIGTLLPQARQTLAEVEQQHAAKNATPMAANLDDAGVAESVDTVSPPSQSNREITLDQRVQATQQLLNDADADDFTIQLTLIDLWADSTLQQYLQQAAQDLQNEQLFVYQALIGGRQVYSVLFGRFPDRQSATRGLQQLPDRLRQDGAFLRTLKGIRSDIEKTRLAATQ
jgi:type II secretory pathway predicted ATPase ExeA